MFKAIATLLVLVSAPALAEDKAPKKAKSDQDRVVCERYEVTGSRLATQRICKTVREWEAARQDQRQQVERAQQNVGMPSGN